MSERLRLTTLLEKTRLLIANELSGGNSDGVPKHIWDGISYVDSDGDESDGENNNESVRASGLKCLTDGKDRKESVGNNSLLDARTFLISRDASRLTEAHSSGITFILVRGGDKSLCVVSRDKSQDIGPRLDDILDRHQGFLAKGLDMQPFAGYFAKGLGMQPFAAATLSVGAGEKPLSCFPGVKKAMFFLRRILRSKSAFTYEKTVQTAITALVYLYVEAPKANEIEVRVVKEWTRGIELMEVGEIEERLSSVQEEHEHPRKLQCTGKMKGLRSQQASTSVADH